MDYRNEKSKLIGKKLSIPQINASLISNEAQQNEKMKEIAELDNEIAVQKTKFGQALNTFNSQLSEWKKQFVLTAPISGTIRFARFLQQNQYLQANTLVCFINPENLACYAETYIPQTNFGKIKTGQSVLLKLPAYPFEQYGAVKGRLDFISNITTDSGYLAKIILPNGLITSYGRHLQFREGLSARAEIITQDMRLLQRVYYGLVKQH